MKRKIIIDCDPGLDDALAIIAASKIQEIDILGLTTTAGNASLKNTSRNALNLLDSLGWDIPVVLGAEGPLEIERNLGDDNSSFENIKLKKSKKNFSSKNAVDFIYENAKKYKGQIEIFALAPMTNLAMALKKYPDLKEMIKSISFMGGSLDKGNISPWAEFNLFVDPHGADIVFKSGIDISMVGLNITSKEILVKEDIKYFRSLKSKEGELTAMLLEAILKQQCAFGDSRMLAHDLLAFYAMLYPKQVKLEKFNVSIEKDLEKRGMLSFNKAGKSKINVVMDINKKDFRSWIYDIIKV